MTRRAVTCGAVAMLAAVAGCSAAPRGDDRVGPTGAGPGRAAPATGILEGCPPARALKQPPGTGDRVALTFDDGPNPGVTTRILEILAQAGVRATFFDTGANAKAHPDLLRAEVAGGHIVGGHSWDHPPFTRLASARVADQLQRTARIIHETTGKPVCFVRPPFGDTNPRVASVIKKAGFSQVLWSLDTVDWKRPGVDKIVGRAVAGAGRPQNILMHAGKADAYPGSADRSQTVRALPQILARLKARGAQFVQVDGSPFPDA